ncbi:MAG: hypothetical protein Q4A06_09670 [Cardiobacteriaceae bacterium]|nr:hypothetical protein [Cardiobacteriaceae bacterium]
MSSPSRFPNWRHPDELLAILDALPDTKLNRALYELLWQYDGENANATQQQTLFILLAHPRYRGCKNLHRWIDDALLGGMVWAELLPHIEAQLGFLHAESCRAFGDHGGMHADTDTLEAIVTRLFAHDSDNAHDIIWSILYWHQALRERHPEWGQWLRGRIAALH